jgi:hypothetical protein
MLTCHRCYLVPETHVCRVPYTVCKMIPEERCEVIHCRRCKMVPEEHTCMVPYVTCKVLTEERVCQVPQTFCTMQPYTVTYKTCRLVPVCEPVCEPCCPPGPLGRRESTTEWYARLTDRVLHDPAVRQASADGK